MLPDRVSNPGPLTYESGALPIALRGPAEKTLITLDKCTGLSQSLHGIHAILLVLERCSSLDEVIKLQ